jgi:FkbH-like protein
MDIGLDALVFVDDNPAERARVRGELPEVAVLDLPEDPADYAAALAATGWFETVRVTAEDLARAGQYRANVERKLLAESAATYDDFLASLRMRAVVAPIDELNLQRTTQLINKTNQFNLTTRRYTERQVRELAADTDVLTRYLKLRDRFGDNGLVAVIIARFTSPTEIEVDSLLMSCRVLKRNAEIALVASLLSEARRRGAATVRASFLSTPKNALVRELLPSLGFTLDRTEGANAHYTLALTDGVHERLMERARSIELVPPAAYSATEEQPR